MGNMPLNLEQIKKSEEINSYIRKADESLSALGYTEHSYAHAGRVSSLASEILLTLGYDARTAELAAIAGWMHDIGNIVNRHDHAQSGAIMAFRILDKMGAAPDEVATIITAIGNHDEETAYPVNAVAAALIMADKTDVRSNRVRNQDPASFDIEKCNTQRNLSERGRQQARKIGALFAAREPRARWALAAWAMLRAGTRSLEVQGG